MFAIGEYNIFGTYLKLNQDLKINLKVQNNLFDYHKGRIKNCGFRLFLSYENLKIR